MSFIRNHSRIVTAFRLMVALMISTVYLLGCSGQARQLNSNVRQLEELNIDEYSEMLMSIDGIFVSYAPSHSATESFFNERIPQALSDCSDPLNRSLERQDALWTRVSEISSILPRNDQDLVQLQFDAVRLLENISREYSSGESTLNKCLNPFGIQMEFVFSLKEGSLAQEFTPVPNRASATGLTDWATKALEQLAIGNKQALDRSVRLGSEPRRQGEPLKLRNLEDRGRTVVLKSRPGLFSAVGQTVYGPEGMYTTVGNITYGPRGMYSTVGNITYQPDGSSCSYLNGAVLCN